MEDNTLNRAKEGDINAFQKLFAEFQPQLKSYLYRLLTDRNDAEDATHDTFVKAFDKISTFRGDSSLKTWVFSIATRLAYDMQRQKKRWKTDAQDLSKTYAISTEEVGQAIRKANVVDGESTYEMREHIDFCFTCISKTLVIEQQVVVLLKDVYDFSVREISQIMDSSEGVVKHLLHDGRGIMTDVFDSRCALINKNGVCHQCSELNGVLNPKQDQQEALASLELVKASKKFDRDELYKLRATLVSGIDPLKAKGANVHEVIMKCTRVAIGELASIEE